MDGSQFLEMSVSRLMRYVEVPHDVYMALSAINQQGNGAREVKLVDVVSRTRQQLRDISAMKEQWVEALEAWLWSLELSLKDSDTE